MKKSKEAALAAIQIFNNPNMQFKSEAYIVLTIIAWTYMLHAYYRENKIEYRHYKLVTKRKRFDKTKHGAYKYWELERCLNEKRSPIDKHTKNNLLFLIGIRHEIEHQMTTKIDDLMSAKFQACCLNYNFYIKKLFGEEHAIENSLSISLQLSSINEETKDLLIRHKELPQNILSYINSFEENLTENEYAPPQYAYRVFFMQKSANHRGSADRVIEFVRSDSPLAEHVNKQYAVIKETEKHKYRPKQIVDEMKRQGYTNFNMHHHTTLWQKMDAKNKKFNYGSEVAGSTWYWYQNWFDEVRKHCEENSDKYR